MACKPNISHTLMLPRSEKVRKAVEADVQKALEGLTGARADLESALGKKAAFKGAIGDIHMFHPKCS